EGRRLPSLRWLQGRQEPQGRHPRLDRPGRSVTAEVLTTPTAAGSGPATDLARLLPAARCGRCPAACAWPPTRPVPKPRPNLTDIQKASYNGEVRLMKSAFIC